MSEKREAQTPESWVGERVMIARSSSMEAELVSLEGINDWGVVCVYEDAEVHEPVLVPWGSLSWLRLAVQQEIGIAENDSGDSENSNDSGDSDQLGE